MNPITFLPRYGQNILEEARKDIILENTYENIDLIFPHEEVLEERSSGLINYISSLKPWTIVPSILICSDSGVIIDGHHRYYVLKKLGYEKVPVTLIKYDSKKIITHNIKDKQLSKKFIIKSAMSKKLLEPKSSMHHYFHDSNLFPVILLSDLRTINYEQ